jgi:hypothetical protein
VRTVSRPSRKDTRAAGLWLLAIVLTNAISIWSTNHFATSDEHKLREQVVAFRAQLAALNKQQAFYVARDAVDRLDRMGDDLRLADKPPKACLTHDIDALYRNRHHADRLYLAHEYARATRAYDVLLAVVPNQAQACDPAVLVTIMHVP